MAKKLVFDRTISVSLPYNGTVTIPHAELWKFTTTRPIRCEDSFDLSKETSHLIGESTSLSNISSETARVVGIAFKIVEA
nr:MAG TPA: hypothetical protein [Caudoviricetes sp.]